MDSNLNTVKITRRCIGFGEYEGTCKNKAGSTHSDHWCQRCDDIRLNTITAKMESIAKGFDFE